MIDPPDDRLGFHLEFLFFKIQHAHGQKMIDPPIRHPNLQLFC